MGGLLFFTLFTFFFNDYARGLENESIVGGSPAQDCQFKYQVSVQLHGQHYCGGAIIANRFVVTAAHCVLQEGQQPFVGLELTVLAGISKLTEPSPNAVRARVEKIFLHSSHVPGQTVADVAVLKLASALDLNGNPCLAKLELAADEKYEGKPAVVSGFGSVSLTNKRDFIDAEKKDIVPSDRLHFLRTKVIPNLECRGMFLLYKKFFPKVPLVKISEKFICIRSVESINDPPRGTCSGDSGGPVVVDNKILVGIVNVGPLNCDEYYAPGGHARVSSYRKFIEQATNDDSKCLSISVKSVTVCILSDDN